PVRTDDERHDAAGPVLQRVGDECEPSSHATADDVAALPARCIGPLRREDAKPVATPRSVRAVFARSHADGGTQRARVARRGGWPVETVLLSGRAVELLRAALRAASRPSCVGILRLYVETTCGNGFELVGADPSLADLLDPAGAVPIPALAFLHERDRHRPVVRADDEHERIRS